MYELALHECTGMKINGTVIYSFDLGRTVDVDDNNAYAKKLD
jgi:hypothetical protein